MASLTVLNSIVRNGTFSFPASQCFPTNVVGATACVRCDAPLKACIYYKGDMLCLRCAQELVDAMPTFDPQTLVGLTLSEASNRVTTALPGTVVVPVARVDDACLATALPTPGLLVCMPHIKVHLNGMDVVSAVV